MQATLTAINRPGTPYTRYVFDVKGSGVLIYWAGREAWTYEWKCEGVFDSSILNGIINAHEQWRIDHNNQEAPIGTVLSL